MKKAILFLMVAPLCAETLNSSDVLGLIHGCQDTFFKGAATFLVKQAVMEDLEDCPSEEQKLPSGILCVDTTNLARDKFYHIAPGNEWYIIHATGYNTLQNAWNTTFEDLNYIRRNLHWMTFGSIAAILTGLIAYFKTNAA